MYLFKTFMFLLLFYSSCFSDIIKIDKTTSFQEILPHAKIYIDKSKNLTLEEIKTKKFIKNNKTFLAYGYSPDFAVWVKFTLQNTSNNTIEKILQYDHEITSNIQLFNENKIYQVGILNLQEPRKTLNPIFYLQLDSKEIKTYYIRASSFITPLLVKLNLWDAKTFYPKEINHQFILALFFGAMFILAIYNLFIYFTTNDTSYFWYVMYILWISIHHTFYIGLISKFESNVFINYMGTTGTYIMITFPIISLALFSKYFLNTKQYPKINKVLDFYIITTFFSVITFILFDYTIGWQNLYYISFIFYLFIIALYAMLKKNRQAYFVVLGWFVLFISWLFMYLSSMGIFQIYEYFPYLVEVGILGEAIIFSFALAHRIKTLQKDKEQVSQKLITQEKTEKQRLEKEVTNKTKDLKEALNQKELLLDEKELLFKELNHRVKNNMQMVISMMRLQSDKIANKKIKEVFLSAQNRINTMSHLHELLYKQENITHINTYQYFSMLIDQLIDTSSKDIEVEYNIKTDLKMEQAIYCGLILNELISNSFKHAFKDKGVVKISLKKQNDICTMSIQDDGIGFDSKEKTDSLGLILVTSLVKKQLKGSISFDNSLGSFILITWTVK